LIYRTAYIHFKDDAAILSGARFAIAMQLANDFRVFDMVRKIYRANATLKTEPTTEGKKTIDPFHYAHGLQYLTEKPAKKFLDSSMSPADFWSKVENPALDNSTQFLWLMKAEAEGLLTMEFVDPSLQYFMDMLEPTFLSPASDSIEWDAQRRLVLEQMLKDFILPKLRTEFRAEIVQSSNKRACMQGGAKLKSMAEMAPYRPKAREFETNDETCLQELNRDKLDWVMSICIGDDRTDPNYAVLVNSDGQLQEHFAIDGFRGERLDQLIEMLSENMERNKPMCVVINTAERESCRRVFDRLKEVSTQIHDTAMLDASNRGEDDTGHVPHAIHITYENDEVAQMYANSKRAEKEFPNYDPILRRAVSLARYVQNPVAELSAMWNLQGGDEDTSDLLSLNLHPLQESLPRSLLMSELEKVFVDVVNDVGVDINQACRYSHLMPQLHFVAGLGPRKAQILKHAWTRQGVIQRRKEIRENDLFGPVVFRNSAGFIRIRQDADNTSDVVADKFDDTRVHPDFLDTAKNVISSALDFPEEEDSPIEKINDAIEDLIYEAENKVIVEKAKAAELNLIWTPDDGKEIEDKLSALDLAQMEDSPQSILKLIVSELRFPFRDHRPRRRDPGLDELFEMFTGETKMSLRVGMNVHGTVFRIKESSSNDQGFHNPDVTANIVEVLVCDKKLKGFIRIDDRHQVTSSVPSHRMGFAEAEGDVVECRLLRLEKDRFSCSLANREDAIFQLPDKIPEFDKFCDEEKAKQDYIIRLQDLRPETAENAKAEDRKERIIEHPSFKNVLCLKDAVEHLSGEDKTAGDIIFRPSSQDDCLFLTWLVHTREYGNTQRLVVNIVIEEKDKTNAVQVGQKLKIKDKDDEYDDLDEILVMNVYRAIPPALSLSHPCS
jgi:transcription elongation factor SPT6